MLITDDRQELRRAVENYLMNKFCRFPPKIFSPVSFTVKYYRELRRIRKFFRVRNGLKNKNDEMQYISALYSFRENTL
jgi:hypothetical protein